MMLFNHTQKKIRLTTVKLCNSTKHTKILPQIVEKFDDSSPRSQQPVTCPQLQPDHPGHALPPPNQISWRSISMLSFHKCSDFFPSVLPTKTLCTNSFPPLTTVRTYIFCNGSPHTVIQL